MMLSAAVGGRGVTAGARRKEGDAAGDPAGNPRNSDVNMMTATPTTMAAMNGFAGSCASLVLIGQLAGGHG